MKFKNLWLLAASVILITACGDDDEKPSNSLTYDGNKQVIQYASFDGSELEDGNYDLLLSPTIDGEDQGITLQISSEWNAKTVKLTEVDDEFDWSWYVRYYATENDVTNTVFEGFGGSVAEFEDVTGGTLYIKLINAEQKIFEVKATIQTTAGKTMKVYYKGKFVDSDASAIQ